MIVKYYHQNIIVLVIRPDWIKVYYWEVNWPRFFSNRDYVAARRAVIIDSENPQVSDY